MNFILLAAALVVAALTIFFVYKKEKAPVLAEGDITVLNEESENNKKRKFNFTPTKILLLVLSGLFIVCYFLRMFTVDFFSGVRLTQGSELFSNGEIVFLTILRFLTQGLVVFYMVTPLFKIKSFNTALGFYGTAVTLLNILFFKKHLIAFEGSEYSFFSYRAIEFAIELVICSSLSAYYLYDKIKSKSWTGFWKECLIAFAIIFGMGILMMHPSTFENLFEISGVDEAEGFNQTHRICLYLIIIASMILHFTVGNKEEQIKYATCLVMSIAGISSFFITYTFIIPLTALPLHLCNAALIILLFAVIFKSKKLFYFTYFVNVLGALFALLLPDTNGAILTEDNIRFWITHIIVVMVPILAVAWKLFPRPNLKMMKNSIIVFSLYFVVACLSNMIISNYDPGVNYFFLQNAFFIEKFPWAHPIRANFAYSFSLWGLNFTVWPVYWLVIYVVYIFSMFLMWLAYAYIYSVRDSLGRIRAFEKMDVMDLRKFKKEILKGRKLSEPIKELNNMLSIKNFTKIYGSSTTPAVENFSLEIKEGEVFGFLGHNGAGKSTLIKSIVGIQSITKGNITVCGYDIVHQPLQAKLNIGYVSDNHAVYEKLTGRDYINFVADLYLVSKEDRDARLEELARLFKLEKDIDRQIKGYSHGMKQKLVVIASIIHDPKVWVLDEPLTGLDPMSAHQIKTLMREKANQGNIVFFSSHVIEIVEKICDKIAIIAKGKLRGVFDVKQLIDNGISLEELYLNIQENPDYELSDEVKKLDLSKSSVEKAAEVVAENSSESTASEKVESENSTENENN